MLETSGFQTTTNLTFQVYVSPHSITGSDNSTIIIIVSVGGGVVLIAVIVLAILCIRRKRGKKLHNNGK